MTGLVPRVQCVRGAAHIVANRRLFHKDVNDGHVDPVALAKRAQFGLQFLGFDHGDPPSSTRLVVSCPAMKPDWRNLVIAGLAGALLWSLWEQARLYFIPPPIGAVSMFPESRFLESVDFFADGATVAGSVPHRPPPRTALHDD